MKIHVYDNNFIYTTPDDIGLSEKFLNALNVKDGDLVDVTIDSDGKLVVSPLKTRCRISQEELNKAIENALGEEDIWHHFSIRKVFQLVFDKLNIVIEE